MSTEDVLEDALISDVLGVTVRSTNDDSKHFLSGLAQELSHETDGQVRLGTKIIDRVLMSRLLDEPPVNALHSPFQYLLSCYANLYKQSHSIQHVYRNQKSILDRLNNALVELKNLLLSHAALVFMGVIPQAETANGLELLMSFEAEFKPKRGVEPLPSLFLSEFVASLPEAESPEDDVVLKIVQPICTHLMIKLNKALLSEEVQQSVLILTQLIAVEKFAKCVVELPLFTEPHEDGCRLEMRTLLGAFLSVGPFPDYGNQQRPDIGREYFANYSTADHADLNQSMLSLKRSSEQYIDFLHVLIFSMLKKKEIRPRIIEWLRLAIESNKARSQMRPNPALISSDSFCYNLCTVLLKLCEPFIDGDGSKAFSRIDIDYVLQNCRIDFKEETRLSLSLPEVETAEKAAAERRRGNTDYHFICECFFMTLKALHLGVVKIITGQINLSRSIQRYTDGARTLESALQAESDPIRRTQLEIELKRCNVVLDSLNRKLYCMETIVVDDGLLINLNNFYRLVVVWMTRMTCSSSSGSFAVPLPEPVPISFAVLPEYFLEDVVDVLIHTGRVAPQVLESVSLPETVRFFVALMSSASYVKNPYLRVKLAEVLHACLPSSLARHPAMRRRTQMLAFVFDNDPFIIENLVPCLLQLYVTIESTGRDTQFYEKFMMRTYIGEVLEYVWGIPEHEIVWKQVAEKDGGRGLYLQFCNMLINDSIYLLDESLKKLKEMREIETLMAQTEEWNRLTVEEKRERRDDLRQLGMHLRASFAQAKAYVKHLRAVTKETQRTFLLPEMIDRVASMLNYFLKYISGPERRHLKIHNLEEYDFDPKDLLIGILEVYLNLESAVYEHSFALAVASDGRSYHEAMFDEALEIVERKVLMEPGQLEGIRGLAQKCKAAALEGAKEDEILGEIPEEFLDQIQYTLMRDPVILPTSSQILDRATITRHLLSDAKDPFNRKPLTVAMLQPHVELKERIDRWLKEQKDMRK